MALGTARLDPFDRIALLAQMPPPSECERIRLDARLTLAGVALKMEERTGHPLTPQAVRRWEQGTVPQDKNLPAYVELLHELQRRVANA